MDAQDKEITTIEGLVEYISHYTDEFFENTDISCRLEIPDTLPAFTLAAEVRHTLFLVTKEAFNNIIKHSRATRLLVQVSASTSTLQVLIEDNGCGLPAVPATDGRKGNGLANMRKRIEALGGRFSIQSAPARGTRLEFTVPLSSRQPAEPKLNSAPRTFTDSATSSISIWCAREEW